MVEMPVIQIPTYYKRSKVIYTVKEMSIINYVKR